MPFKKINRKDYERLQALTARVCEALSDRTLGVPHQAMIISRGDMRAIQWAAWYLRELLAEKR